MEQLPGENLEPVEFPSTKYKKLKFFSGLFIVISLLGIVFYFVYASREVADGLEGSNAAVGLAYGDTDLCGLEEYFALNNTSSEDRVAHELFCYYEDTQKALNESDPGHYSWSYKEDGKYYFTLYRKSDISGDTQKMYFEVQPSLQKVTPRLPYIDDYQVYNSEELNIINIPNTLINLSVPKKYNVSIIVEPEKSQLVLTGSFLANAVHRCKGYRGMPGDFDWKYCEFIIEELEQRGLSSETIISEEINVEISVYYSELTAEAWALESLFFQGQNLQWWVDEHDSEAGEYLKFGDNDFYALSSGCCGSNDFSYIYATKDLNEKGIVIKATSKDGKSSITEKILGTIE